jgi:cytochrome P450
VAYAHSASRFGILMQFLMLFANKKDLRAIVTHMRLSAEKVRERLEIGDDPNSDKADLWAYILRNKGDKSMTVPEMEVNAAFLVSAATTPVADALCGTVYLLAKNREVLDKLKKEIDSHITSEADITMSTTAKMSYLLAVLNESMRCYTPTPGGGRRKAPPDGAMVAGHFVPGGVSIFLVYRTHGGGQWLTFTLDCCLRLPASNLHIEEQLRPS